MGTTEAFGQRETDVPIVIQFLQAGYRFLYTASGHTAVAAGSNNAEHLWPLLEEAVLEGTMDGLTNEAAQALHETAASLAIAAGWSRAMVVQALHRHRALAIDGPDASAGPG